MRRGAEPRSWTNPHQKPGNLCSREWGCGEPAHHHNCSDCEAHCRLGVWAEDHERADPSDAYHVTHCRCDFCTRRRGEDEEGGVDHRSSAAIEPGLDERQQLTAYVAGPFNPQASVEALAQDGTAAGNADAELDAWWRQQKSKAGVA